MVEYSYLRLRKN